ncbi:MAG TPA: sulfotransferase [Solirubrobacteraceae bacterium]|nr:sulfotransferase [Solirubrobacteraceae bacterium]
MSQTPPSDSFEPGSRTPKVLYVMGAGRSGSTILGVALGNCEGVFYAGELDKWLPRAGRTPVAGEERERFWEEVRAQVDADGVTGGGLRALERSSELLDPRRLRTRHVLRPRYLQVAAQLFGAIARTSGAERLVDSSHYPMRARELQRLGNIELYLLFLVRDPESAVASLGREDVPERRYGVLAANAYLWLTHLLASWVFVHHPRGRRVFVRHEEFLAEPTAIVNRILLATGSQATLDDLTLATGVPFQGNRLIRSPTVTLQAGAPAAPPRSLLTRVLQLPWRLVFKRLESASRELPAEPGPAHAERANA